MQLNSFFALLAFAAPPANSQSGQPQGPNMLLFMVPLFVIMYFVMIRPQQKRAKQQRIMLEALKSGDEVVTAAGIVGTVITVKDKTVTLRSGDAKFEVTKASVSEIIADTNVVKV